MRLEQYYKGKSVREREIGRKESRAEALRARDFKGQEIGGNDNNLYCCHKLRQLSTELLHSITPGIPFKNNTVKLAQTIVLWLRKSK